MGGTGVATNSCSMKLHLVFLFALVTSGSAAYTPCISPCFVDASIAMIDSTLGYVRQSEDWTTAWKRECSCPAKADAFKNLALQTMIASQIVGPELITSLNSTAPAKQGNEPCSLKDLSELYQESVQYLLASRQALEQSRLVGQNSLQCEAIIKTYDEELLSFYLVADNIIGRIINCTASCEVSHHCYQPCLPGAEVPCEGAAIQQWILSIGKAYEQAAIQTWDRLPSACKCCWDKHGLALQVKAEAYSSAFMSAYAVRKAISTPVKSLGMQSLKSADTRPSDDCDAWASFSLIKVSLGSLTATSELSSQVVSVSNCCPQFKQTPQFNTTTNQLEKYFEADNLLFTQLDDYLLALLAECPAV